MIACKFETEISDGMIKIPEQFKEKIAGKFQVIIIPQKKKQNRLRQALLDSPVWSDADVQAFKSTVEKGYEKWSPEEL
jgi:hypothetical protein